MNRGVKGAVAVVAVALLLWGCGGGGAVEGGAERAGEPRPDGGAILRQMSERLKSATAFTFSTAETSERVRRNDERVTVNLEHRFSVRRPDRLWFKATGDHDLELFYDGKRVTLVSHKEKVFGEFPAAATLAETVDVIGERYDVPLPIADLLSLDPDKALVNEQTTGGWEKRETVDGVECNKLAYQHPNVDFAVWVPAAGDPLPKRLYIKYKARRGQPSTTVTFRDWNLSPQLNDETFARKVPDDYEGIPVIQRAASVIPHPEEQGKAQASPEQPAQPARK